MAKIDVFNHAWTDLVFEGRNKEYGAYQLRREDNATTAKALFLGIGLLAALVSIPVLVNYFDNDVIPVPEYTLPDPYVIPVELPKPPVKPIPVQEQAAGAQASSKKQVAFTKPVVTSKPVENVVPKTDDFTDANPSNHNDAGNSGNDIAIGSNGSSTGTAITGNGTGTGAVPDGIEKPEILAGLDASPVFPGGMNKFYEQVSSRFRTPEDDAAGVIKVLVYFVIEKDGTMTGIQVARAGNEAMKKEAIRVLSSIKTKWKPGIKNGRAVRTAYNLPVTINIH